MKITSFDRANLRSIADDFKATFDAIETRYGIKLTMKGTRYDENSATFKIEGVTIGQTGLANSPERSDFLAFHLTYGLPKEVLDQQVILNGENYIVRGLNIRSPKYCVVGERVRDSKRFKLTPESVSSAWVRLNPIAQPVS